MKSKKEKKHKNRLKARDDRYNNEIREYKNKYEIRNGIISIILVIIVGMTLIILGIIKTIKGESYYLTAKLLNGYTPYQILVGIASLIFAIYQIIKLIKNIKKKNKIKKASQQAAGAVK